MNAKKFESGGKPKKTTEHQNLVRKGQKEQNTRNAEKTERNGGTKNFVKMGHQNIEKK